MNLKELKKILEKSWTKETSYFPDQWNESHKSWGQCAVSALIVNDYFNGDIVWVEALLPNGQKLSHYFNLINNQNIDLTRDQFPPQTIFSKATEKRKKFSSTREFILSNKNTKKRYELLKKNISKIITKT